ncbi:MAG: superfamily II DNA/RNA helicase [Verrucomicrobiales bacterium]|jgi:superfamily II DNA/RNA helicase
MTKSFAQLGLPSAICDALEERGITDPFEIQAATIEDALAGRDVCGRAPTGSGKTLAFGLPLVATVERATPKFPRALILAPTRELADQIHVELASFSGKVRVGVVYGGVGYGPQLNLLRKGVDILVACPGRLEDLIERGDVSLRDVSQIVLDEADRMADMGFMPAVRRILGQTAKKRQTVLFSATLDGDVAKLTRDYQNNPVRHEVGEETPDITSASHIFWKSQKEDRTALTTEAINAVWPAIVFSRTRHGADRIAKQLDRAGVKAAAIHGGRSQSQRTRALADFSENRVQALIATDVAARGIHVDGVALVVHYDPPEDFKTYVHRSGRTARAGEGGVVVSLIQGDQRKDMGKVQRQIGLDEPLTDPDVKKMKSLSPAAELTLAPPRPGQQQPQGNGGGNGRRSGSGRGHGKNGSRKRSNGNGNGQSKHGGGNRQGNGHKGSSGQKSSSGSGRSGGSSNGGQRSSGGRQNAR